MNKFTNNCDDCGPLTDLRLRRNRPYLVSTTLRALKQRQRSDTACIETIPQRICMLSRYLFEVVVPCVRHIEMVMADRGLLFGRSIISRMAFCAIEAPVLHRAAIRGAWI